MGGNFFSLRRRAASTAFSSYRVVSSWNTEIARLTYGELHVCETLSYSGLRVAGHANTLDLAAGGECAPETLLDITGGLVALACALALLGVGLVNVGLIVNEAKVTDEDASSGLGLCGMSNLIDADMAVQDDCSVQAFGSFTSQGVRRVDGVCVCGLCRLDHNLLLCESGLLGNGTGVGG
jgi:hypothetical protein